MNPIIISLIVFVCVFGGALLGMLLRAVMPKHHLSEESKDVIKLGMGLIATIAALVLGLVIATAKNTYDTQDSALKHAAAKIMLLDRVLAQYGPETKGIRESIRRTVARRVDEIWPEERYRSAKLDTPGAAPTADSERFEFEIWQLAPKNEAQKGLQTRALDIGNQIMETRLFILGSRGSSIPLPFFFIVVFWLTIIFMSFGIFAPRNATVIAVLFVCSLSVACAIFLILEMDQPFSGVMKVPSTPLRYAISHLAQ